MASIVQLNNTGVNYVLYVARTQVPVDAQVLGELQAAHAIAAPLLGFVSPMNVTERSGSISLYYVALGGSVRPSKKPDLGFVYPRRLT